MNLSLRPDVYQFIDEQVKAGRFSSPEAVIEAAITRMKLDDDGSRDLDDATIDAINEAESQADRGEGMDLKAFRAHLASRLGING